MRHNFFYTYIVGSTALFLVPLFASAAVSLTEVMYDLAEGGDSGREWVEVHNTGTETVSLTGWKFFEGGVNHGLTLAQGSETIPAGGVGIIADNPTNFLADHPGFSGTIFDSSFSLSNTGETLTLRDENLADVDTVSYTSEQGGAGDGNSLQKTGGSWHGATPTPGAVSGTPAQTEPPAQEPTEPEAAAPPAPAPAPFSQGSGERTTWPEEPQVFADAGPATRIGIAGADLVFEGRAWGVNKNEPIQSARMLWTFGDGSSKEGNLVTHRFSYPGIYTVVLETTAGYFSGTDRVEVKVVPAELAIVRVMSGPQGFIEIANRGNEEIDLSYWMLRTGGRIAILPRNTFVGPRRTIIFSEESTTLLVPVAGYVELLYPNGAPAVSYDTARGQSSVPYVPIVPVRSAATTPTSASNMTAQASVTSRTLASTSALGEVLGAPLPEGSGVSLLSTVGTANGTAPLWPWLLAVIILAFGTIAGAFHIRRNEPALLEAPALSADDFEILEAEDEESGRKDANPIPF